MACKRRIRAPAVSIFWSMELDMATLTVSPSTKSRGQNGQSRNFRLHDCIGLFRDPRERVRAAKNTHILLFQSVGSHRFSQMICATRPHLSQTWNVCFFMLNSQSLFLSHAFHIALVTSYDGCPDGEGCSRTEVLIKKHAQCSL